MRRRSPTSYNLAVMPPVWPALLLFFAASATPRFDAGVQFYESGDCAAAVRALAQSERLSEEAPARAFYQGVCLAKQGAWDDAAARLAPYAAAHPDQARAWYWLARANLHRKKFIEARDAILKAIGLSGTSADAYRTLGEIELELKNYQGAYSAWMRANDLNSQDGRTTYYLGRLFFEADFLDEAAGWFRRTLKLIPNQFAAMTYLGLCSEHLNDRETALQLYRAAIAESTRQRKPYCWAYLDLAKLLRQLGRDKEALDLLQKAEEAGPEGHVLTFMGQMLAPSDPAAAQAALRRAIALDSNIPDAHYRLAMLLRAAGNSTEAQSEMQEFQRTKEMEERNKAKITAFRRDSPDQ